MNNRKVYSLSYSVPENGRIAFESERGIMTGWQFYASWGVPTLAVVLSSVLDRLNFRATRAELRAGLQGLKSDIQDFGADLKADLRENNARLESIYQQQKGFKWKS